MHIIYPEQQFPFHADNAGAFPPFPARDYEAVAKQVGIERAVVVVTPAYKADNRCVFQAMEDLALDTRAVVALPVDAPDEALRDARAAGAQGLATFMIDNRGVVDWTGFPRLAAKAADFGLHVDLQMDGNELPERLALLKELPCPLVIDHIGKFRNPPVAVTSAAVQALFRLLDTGNVYVKLSAAGETSNDTPPYMKDSGLIAKSLAERYPERLFWASNWPHLGDKDPADKPDTGVLMDCLLTWAEDAGTRHKILVENPGRFYFGDPV